MLVAIFLSIAAAAEPAVEYSTQIAPLLAERCIQCHGTQKQSNGLRLDSGLHLLQGGDAGAAVVAGDPEASLLYQVISGKHDTLKMPPEGEALGQAEIALVRDWISQGASVPADEKTAEVDVSHWAFQPIQRPLPPAVQDESWARNPIDQFVITTLAEAGVAPAPEADRETLIRRLYLDLLGLPPSPREVRDFVADPDPYAYEQLVAKLLASPHFGERWGRHWLDLARYADSDGYEKDNGRPYAYRYRDYLINAINNDTPFDQFVIEQLAGDLLPNPTQEQLLATGFHRNTLTNREGGIDPEEDRVKQAADRTNTTGAVFMGLTVGCAECHTHKYDPITHREYFGLYAFFNEAIEKDIAAPRPGEMEAYETAKTAFDGEIADIQKQIEEYRPQLAEHLPEWEKTLDPNQHGWQVLDIATQESKGGAAFEKLEDQSLLVTGESPDTDTYTLTTRTEEKEIRAIRLQALTHEQLTQNGPGRAHNGNFVLAEFKVFAAPVDRPGEKVEVKLAGVTADFEQPGHPASQAIDGDLNTGWAIYQKDNMNQDRQAIFLLEAPLGFEGGTELTFVMEHTYGRAHNIGRLRLASTTGDPATINYPDAVFAALRTPAAERTPEQQNAVIDYYGMHDARMRALQTTLETLREAAPQPPQTMAQTMAQNPAPPKTHIHLRGDFLSPGDEVEPGVPAFLHELKPRGARPDRLDLARWIVAPENPLTARVAVNRIWEKLFGEGLVRTSEDFGVRSELPTHPLLLDWLADEFMRLGWSRKQLITLIVSSSAYRQASEVRPELLEQDPENRLIARQNRFRVEAEITRDLLLAVSGLLNAEIGGPSVRPPLPEGYEKLGYANSITWAASEGEDKYRRGVYIWFQRMIAYPMLMTFDCPDSNVSALKRNRSNTPLQALALLNDPVLFECAQAFGKRMILEGPEEIRERIRQSFEICFARLPQERELDALLALYDDQLDAFSKLPEEAAQFVGGYLPENTDPAVAAAHVALARTMLNLDEFVTRE